MGGVTGDFKHYQGTYFSGKFTSSMHVVSKLSKDALTEAIHCLRPDFTGGYIKNVTRNKKEKMLKMFRKDLRSRYFVHDIAVPNAIIIAMLMAMRPNAHVMIDLSRLECLN